LQQGVLDGILVWQRGVLDGVLVWPYGDQHQYTGAPAAFMTGPFFFKSGRKPFKLQDWSANIGGTSYSEATSGTARDLEFFQHDRIAIHEHHRNDIKQRGLPSLSRCAHDVNSSEKMWITCGYWSRAG